MGISFSTLARLEISFLGGCISTAVVFVASFGNIKASKACIEFTINKAKHGIVGKSVQALWSTFGLVSILVKEKHRCNDFFEESAKNGTTQAWKVLVVEALEIANGLPGVAHLKGIGHYIPRFRDQEGQEKAFKVGSRQIGVTLGGLLGVASGDPKLMPFGGLLVGATVDIFTTIIESKIKNKYCPSGYLKCWDVWMKSGIFHRDDWNPQDVIEAWVSAIIMFIFDMLGGQDVGATFLESHKNGFWTLIYKICMAGGYYPPPKIGGTEGRILLLPESEDILTPLIGDRRETVSPEDSS